MSRMFTADQKKKLTQVIADGGRVLTEIEDLNTGLSETIKALAEEMEIKPSLLKKAVKIAHQNKLGETNADNETIQDILDTVGHTL